jgi:hypothetical protein
MFVFGLYHNLKLKMTDIEMTDAKPNAPKVTEPEEPQDQFYGNLCANILELKKSLVLLEKASSEKDFRQCGVLTKNLKKLRNTFGLADALLALKFYLPDLSDRLKLAAQPTPVMSGLGASVEDIMHCTQARSEAIMKIPETQLFIYILVQMKLIDNGDFKTVRQF